MKKWVARYIDELRVLETREMLLESELSQSSGQNKILQQRRRGIWAQAVSFHSKPGFHFQSIQSEEKANLLIETASLRAKFKARSPNSECFQDPHTHTLSGDFSIFSQKEMNPFISGLHAFPSPTPPTARSVSLLQPLVRPRVQHPTRRCRP
jgi:hypothetical protein